MALKNWILPAILIFLILAGARAVMASGESEPNGEYEPLTSAQVESMREDSSTREEWQADVDRIVASGESWSQVPLGPYDDAIAFCRQASDDSLTPSQGALCNAIFAAATGEFEPGIYETDELVERFGDKQS